MHERSNGNKVEAFLSGPAKSGKYPWLLGLHGGVSVAANMGFILLRMSLNRSNKWTSGLKNMDLTCNDDAVFDVNDIRMVLE